MRADASSPGSRATQTAAQGLKALHGWLTCGSMLSGKPCRSPAAKKGRCRKIQRIAENVPRWPDINTFCAALLNMAVEPFAIVLSWSGWRYLGSRIQNNSGLSEDLKATLR